MDKRPTIKWQDMPQEHDYPAAESYLRLIIGRQAAKNEIRKLKRAAISMLAAKDIFRASRLSLLGAGNGHVDRDRAKIIQQEKISPLLLCVDKRSGTLVVADGYHRLCAVYTFDEDAMIPCKIAE